MDRKRSQRVMPNHLSVSTYPSRPACVPPLASAGPAARARLGTVQVVAAVAALSLGHDASDGAARNTPQPTQLELWACPGRGESETPGGGETVGAPGTPQASTARAGGAGGGKGRGRNGRRVARGGRLQNGY